MTTEDTLLGFLFLALWMLGLVIAGYVYRFIWGRGAKNPKFIKLFGDLILKTPIYTTILAIKSLIEGIPGRLENILGAHKKSIEISITKHIEEVKTIVKDTEVKLIGQVTGATEEIDKLRGKISDIKIPDPPDLDHLTQGLANVRKDSEEIYKKIQSFETTLQDLDVDKLADKLFLKFRASKGGVMKGINSDLRAESKDMAELEANYLPNLMRVAEGMEGLIQANIIKKEAGEKFLALAQNPFWQPKLEKMAGQMLLEYDNKQGGDHGHGSGDMGWR